MAMRGGLVTIHHIEEWSCGVETLHMFAGNGERRCHGLPTPTGKEFRDESEKVGISVFKYLAKNKKVVRKNLTS